MRGRGGGKRERRVSYCEFCVLINKGGRDD